MADDSGEVNTAVEDGEANQLNDVPRLPETGSDQMEGATDGQPRAEKSAAESSWSAPLLTLARKATETISSGVSYAAAPRNCAQASTGSSAENEPEHGLNSSKILPGQLFCKTT